MLACCLAACRAIGQAAFSYSYEPLPGSSHAEQCGSGFDLTVYDGDEKPWAEFRRGEFRDDGGWTYTTIDYSFRSGIDRPLFAAFASNLVAAGVHTLTQPSKETGCAVQAIMTSRVGGKEVHVLFYTPPTGGVQKAIHQLARAFGANLCQTYPNGATVTTQVWEKTTAPARKVDLEYLLRHPKEFLGRRVAVEGFYHGEFECSRLSPEPNKRGLWVDAFATDVPTNAIQWVSNGWVRVTGTYHAYFTEREDEPQGGHMGMSLGELMYVTEFKPSEKTGNIPPSPAGDVPRAAPEQ